MDFLDRYRPLSCIGAHVLDVAAGEARPVLAKKTVLATGGLGQLNLHSTNDAGADFHLPAVRPWVMAAAEPDEELITQDLRVIRNTMWTTSGWCAPPSVSTAPATCCAS